MVDIATLISRYLKPLVLFARQWDDAGAEDVVHDAFLKLAELIGDDRTPRHVVAWLYQTVRNRSIDQCRQQQQRQKHAEAVARETARWFISRDREKNDDRIDALLLTDRLKTLPVEQREVIVAHLWGDLTFREIAQMTGRSFSTVRREYHRGLETLRKSLVPEISTPGLLETSEA